MTAEDTARALMAMSDPEVRRSVALGDLAPLGELELTEHEREILSHAARDDVTLDEDDDVVGFGSPPETFAPPYVPTGPVVGGMVAIRYVEDNLSPNASVRGEFNRWATQFAHGSW